MKRKRTIPAGSKRHRIKSWNDPIFQPSPCYVCKQLTVDTFGFHNPETGVCHVFRCCGKHFDILRRLRDDGSFNPFEKKLKRQRGAR